MCLPNTNDSTNLNTCTSKCPVDISKTLTTFEPNYVMYYKDSKACLPCENVSDTMMDQKFMRVLNFLGRNPIINTLLYGGGCMVKSDLMSCSNFKRCLVDKVRDAARLTGGNSDVEGYISLLEQ